MEQMRRERMMERPHQVVHFVEMRPMQRICIGQASGREARFKIGERL